MLCSGNTFGLHASGFQHGLYHHELVTTSIQPLITKLSNAHAHFRIIYGIIFKSVQLWHRTAWKLLLTVNFLSYTVLPACSWIILRNSVKFCSGTAIVHRRGETLLV